MKYSKMEDLDLDELLEELELESKMVEYPLWEQRDFGEDGFFLGPKHICDKIEELLEEV